MNEPTTPPPPPPPAPPAPPVGPERPGNPWEHRSELGFVKALIDTVKLFVTSPAEAFAQTRETGDYAGPLIYAVIVGWIGVAAGQIWQLIIGASLMTAMPGEMGDAFGPMMATSGVGILFQLLLAPIYVVIGLFVSSGILHLCLMLVGGLKESQSGFEGTFRVVSFASVSNLAQIIPIFGGLLGIVWWIVLGVLGLTSLHRTTQGKAIIAILIPIVLCCLCLVMGMAFFGFAMAGMMEGQ